MTSPNPTPRPGEQLASTTSTTRVIVVRATGGGELEIACGGSPLVPAATVPAASAADGTGTVLGKRYVNADDTLELLCTFSGAGELTYGGEPMTLKAAKPLPASD